MTITEATSTGSNRLDMIAKSIKDKYEKADFADYIISELSTEKLKDFLDKNIKDWQTKAEEQLGLDPSSDNFALDYATEAMYNGKLSAGTLLRKLGTYLSTEELNKILADTAYADMGLDECKTIDESCKHTKESIGSDLAKYQKWVDYDMKRYGRISDRTNNLIKRAGLTIIKDQYGDYEVTDHSPITEDLDEIEIKGNGQKIKVKDDEITIKTCDKDTEEVELKDTEEVIAPLDDEEIAEIDDFDEEDFEELSERYLTEVYNNVNSFKLSKASLNKEGKLKLEGIVTFKSGNKRKTAFLFEKKNSLKSGKIKYIGENLDFSNGRKSFILNCSVNNKKLISESLTYNYTVKDNDGQSKRLYGTVRRNK